jgi:hypothetical protein
MHFHNYIAIILMERTPNIKGTPAPNMGRHIFFVPEKTRGLIRQTEIVLSLSVTSNL